ncbi:hypothetical protein QA802_40315 [Streptomyces sp. B21-105]|uniref:hypothetical protein n=1 Tax=Streptomyces sp. B21-105 TaxID=3039417 RepID=UPI002FF0414A
MALYVTAVLAPVEARGPNVLLLLGDGRPAGAPFSACARLPVLPAAETSGAATGGVAAGDGLSAPAVPDAGFS